MCAGEHCAVAGAEFRSVRGDRWGEGKHCAVAGGELRSVKVTDGVQEQWLVRGDRRCAGAVVGEGRPMACRISS